MGRFSFADARTAASNIDHEKLDATTEADIQRYMIEDGFDPDADYGPCRVIRPPAEVRAIFDMTQEAFAAWIRVPLSTWQEWEELRELPDPAAQTLLYLLASEPEAARRALGPG